MRLLQPNPRSVFTTWHSFVVLGRSMLGDFETAGGAVIRLRRGFRTRCTVRGPDPDAAFERLLPVVSSAAVECLTPTTRSRISARYLGVVASAAGDELVAGVHWTGLKLHPEFPVWSDIGYGIENALSLLQQSWSERPL